MSKPYEELTDEEKIINLLHARGKLGPGITALANALQYQLDGLALEFIPLVKKSFQVSTSLGKDLDKVGAFLDVRRFVGEEDEELRGRITGFIAGYSVVTVGDIEDYFKNIIGKKPYVSEDFDVQVLVSGETVNTSGAGKFVVIFNVLRDVANEKLMVMPEHSYVTLTHEGVVTPDTTTLTSQLTAGVTTIVVASTASFASYGEVMIEDEWISYDSKDATHFNSCTRGLYGTTDATHASSTVVEEGLVNAWLVGSNESVYDYLDDGVVYLKGGPYLYGTWVNVRYRVTVGEDYDELSELVAAIDDFVEVLKEIKAAGIKVDGSIGVIVRSWAQDNFDALVMSDQMSPLDGKFEFDEYMEEGKVVDVPTNGLPLESSPHVFYEPDQWDNCDWDAAFWDDGTAESSNKLYTMKIDAVRPP